MNKKLLIPIVLIVLAGTLAACGGSNDDELEITDVWSRTSAMTQENGAVYATFKSPVDDSLIKASVPAAVAAKTELHETVTSEPTTEGEMGDTMDGQSQMDADSGMDAEGERGSDAEMGSSMMGVRPVAAIELPAGEEVFLEPGGYHIMILELVKPLSIGQTIPVTLTLEEAGEVQVDATVREG